MTQTKKRNLGVIFIYSFSLPIRIAVLLFRVTRYALRVTEFSIALAMIKSDG